MRRFQLRQGQVSSIKSTSPPATVTVLMVLPMNSGRTVDSART